MTKNIAILIATALFASYPTVKTFHVTADGQAFENMHDADAHAIFLDKKTPVVFVVEEGDEALEDAVEVAGDIDAAAEAAPKKGKGKA